MSDGFDTDRRLAAFHTAEQEVWCAKPDCPNHAGFMVDMEIENGIATPVPSDCPICWSSWLYDAPQPKDDEEVDE